jgi:hypothetical protein
LTKGVFFCSSLNFIEDNTSSQVNLQKKPLSVMAGALKWWAHQDLNLGPKDYEQLQEIKTYINQ